MSAAAPVGVLLVTHGRLGRFFLDTLGDMLGDLSLPVEVLEVRRVQDTELLTRVGQHQHAAAGIQALDLSLIHI